MDNRNFNCDFLKINFHFCTFSYFSVGDFITHKPSLCCASAVNVFPSMCSQITCGDVLLLVM